METTTTENTVKASHEVAKEIMKAIATGALKPGQRLVEVQLCELFDVKRNKIREALRKLEHEGFVNITPNVGAVVSEVSRIDIEQMYDLLSVLDGMAVRLVTPCVIPEQLARLEAVLDKMEATDDPALFADHNNEFHTLLCSYSENVRLMKVADNLRLSIMAFGFRSFFAPGQIAASNRDHRKVLQAIKENRPEKAEKIMRKHVLDAKNRLIKWLYKSL
ncbi:MAG TPA: GntR family transcriptional regulator [Desulfomonilaceae bacterium]|nr:GntR family transcriptional regulator [Desulfomonilaceae bacterium]